MQGLSLVQFLTSLAGQHYRSPSHERSGHSSIVHSTCLLPRLLVWRPSLHGSEVPPSLLTPPSLLPDAAAGLAGPAAAGRSASPQQYTSSCISTQHTSPAIDATAVATTHNTKQPDANTQTMRSISVDGYAHCKLHYMHQSLLAPEQACQPTPAPHANMP